MNQRSNLFDSDVQDTQILLKKIGHLLRDPGGGMMHLSALILDGYDGAVSQTAREDVRKMRGLAQRMLDATDRLLDLLTLDHRPLDLGSIDLLPILRAVAATPLLPDVPQVAADLPTALPLVVADEKRIRELLRILVKMQGRLASNRNVLISASVDGGFVVCSVKGKATATRTARLSPAKFIQGQSDDLALELLFAQRFAAQTNGRLWLTGSKNVTFRFSLPIAEPA